MVVGFRGAQVGQAGGDNQTFVPFVEKELTGKVYVHGPRGRAQATKDIVKFKEENPDGEVHILGYSRGGRAAVQVANELGKRGIDVTTLTTFDPHDLNDASIGLRDGVVSDAQNYYQRNPRTGISGPNPFLGRPVTIGGLPIAGQDYTGDLGVNHVNIVEEALLRNRDEILGQ